MSIHWELAPQLLVAGFYKGKELLESSVLPVPLQFEGVMPPRAFSSVASVCLIALVCKSSFKQNSDF